MPLLLFRYEKITTIVSRMKSSSSACPLEKISIVCFKRCPYLRSLSTKIIRVVWESVHVPMEWKKVCKILVHKKGNSDGSANFKPITLELCHEKSLLHVYVTRFPHFSIEMSLLRPKSKRALPQSSKSSRAYLHDGQYY